MISGFVGTRSIRLALVVAVLTWSWPAAGQDAPTVAATRADPPPAMPAPMTPLEQARADYLRSRSLMAEKRYEDAVSLLQQLLVVTPTWSLPKLALAQCYRALARDREQQAALLRDALAVDPDNHLILHEFGLLHEDAGQRAEAVECYLGAVERRPDLIHARERLGALLLAMDRLDEARGHLDIAVAQHPGNQLAISLLATALEGLHRVDEAESWLKVLVGLTPEQPFGHIRLAAFYRRQGRLVEEAAATSKARSLLEKDRAPRPKMRPLAVPPPKKPR